MSAPFNGGDGGPHSSDSSQEKPCKACTDFKTWAKQHGLPLEKMAPLEDSSASSKQIEKSSPNNNPLLLEKKITSNFSGLPVGDVYPIEKHRKRECPPDKSELGRNTWTFLHTMAAYYPDEPTITEQKNMSEFMRLFSEFYPCSYCAKDLRMEMAKTPPVTVTRTEFSYWLCDMHNRVNVKLGKPVFDCKLVDERWKDGWRDGSCNWGS